MNFIPSDMAPIYAARKEELNRRLLVLAEWAVKRATGDHDEATTMTMLKKRVLEIEDGVNRAGWRAASRESVSA